MIEAGASENHIDLGGLPITRLRLSHGAGSADVNFSAPNPAVLSELRLAVDAGKTDAHNLGNANFQTLLVEGGAASCLLDFSGNARQDASARISTAMASVEVRIPRDLAVEVTSSNVLGQPRADAGFSQRGATWLSPAAAAGSPIQLRIHSSMVMGKLLLSSST